MRFRRSTPASAQLKVSGASDNSASVMGYEAGEAAPEFGWKGRVPLADGSPDATEIDMKIGRVIVESKLTEADFTRRPQDVVTRYRDFDSVFDLPMLPQTETDYRGYQLVRNILCAAAHGYVFTLVCDARRPDLIRDWRSVGRAVRDAALRARLRLVLWQELAAEAPDRWETSSTRNTGCEHHEGATAKDSFVITHDTRGGNRSVGVRSSLRRYTELVFTTVTTFVRLAGGVAPTFAQHAEAQSARPNRN